MFDRDNLNYWTDGRVRAKYEAEDSPIVSVDEKVMKAVVRVPGADGEDEEFRLPCRYEVCETCHGRGTHVNPSVDCDGLTAEDFADDPDFADDYFGGCYDVRCNGCDGNRVVPVLDREQIDPAVLARLDRELEQRARDRAEMMWERRMGC